MDKNEIKEKIEKNKKLIILLDGKIKNYKAEDNYKRVLTERLKDVKARNYDLVLELEDIHKKI